MKTSSGLCRFAGVLLFCCSVVSGNLSAAEPTPASAKTAPATFASTTHGLPSATGFFDVYRDVAKGRVLLNIAVFDTPFLLVTSLPYGLGSNDVGLDRGQSGESQLVEFRRIGARIFLVEPNTRYRAISNDVREREDVRQAFAESVLWAGDIVAEETAPNAHVLIDFSSYLLGDRHGIAARLKAAKQGDYSIDKDRSAALVAESKSFPDNTELEALLTFKGAGEGEYVRDVAMDAESLTLRQHLSLVRLPGPGFVPRIYHPASGAFSTGFTDLAQPLNASTYVRYQPRFRLDKTDPSSALSPVKKPIVFYLDPGTPEPVRSALLDGANWWKGAFEQAGFKDAYRVELLPPGADAMDIRYNMINWVHRSTRGWSYGEAISDPRTGEIIRGVVTLGSDRVRQDVLIMESLLAPYGRSDEAARKQQIEAAVLARQRQLAAHEVGHALGFAHNFAASRQGNGSVMDYPHPLLSLDAAGEIDITHAYGVGIGPWDNFLVKHAYGQFAPEQEKTALAALRADIAKAGFGYMSDADARAPGSSHPDALLWDSGTDTLKTFAQILAVRHKALDGFSEGVLGRDRQTGELEVRLVPVYLLHRYQVEAVARLLGGVSYQYAMGGEGKATNTFVSAPQQQAALQALITTLGAKELALPTNVLDLLTPPGAEYNRSREYFATRTAPVFDAVSAVEADAMLTTQFLFDPSRLNRLEWQHARDAAQPGIATVLDQVFHGTWQSENADVSVPAASAVQLAANWVVLDSLLATLEGGQLHAQTQADVRDSLAQWQHWLEKNPGREIVASSRRDAANFIAKYLADAKSVKLHALPVIPPGAPI
ncbi:DUF5117 domain-containing protein [Pseudolysobacter antarcticus]|uniref:DUF5117 domain-containing protein n=1 Tax=Pseudolysobacter antarcticus TaxID=2511995 RepID=A0A411HNS9_9GAMM|nr:zinc-dependent metalloprotease [Pseudolysobacter antarcticus]QBB72143.1 DUF5117 domain-containing protein [Pseudolysobacter antarcticus]